MEPIFDKFAYIQEWVKNKKVLDIGVVCHDVHFDEKWYINGFLHGFLCESAKSVLGIDIEKSGVETLRKYGYNVIVADAEKMDLKEKFDVVIAGDVIEHLSNPGSFIKRANTHLNPDGVLILITPNAFSLRRCIYAILGKKIPVNFQHTCWFNIQTLSQLCARYNFELLESRYIHHIPYHCNKWIKFRIKLLIQFENHCGTIVCVFKKKVDIF